MSAHPNKIKKDGRFPREIAEKILRMRIFLGGGTEFGGVEEESFDQHLDSYQALDLPKWHLEEKVKSLSQSHKFTVALDESRGTFDPDPNNQPLNLRLKRALKNIAETSNYTPTAIDKMNIAYFLEEQQKYLKILKQRIAGYEYYLGDPNDLEKYAKQFYQNDVEFAGQALRLNIRETKLSLDTWSALTDEMKILAEKLGIKQTQQAGASPD